APAPALDAGGGPFATAPSPSASSTRVEGSPRVSSIRSTTARYADVGLSPSSAVAALVSAASQSWSPLHRPGCRYLAAFHAPQRPSIRSAHLDCTVALAVGGGGAGGGAADDG